MTFGPFRSEGFRLAVLVVAVLLAANGTLVAGRHTGRFDASDFFCPYFMLIADHARHGELLTWTPLVECGCPAGFDPEIGAFSPLTVGMAALLGPHEWAFRVYWLVLWSIGALGMLQLARSWQAPWWAAVGAAWAYSFCAAFTNQAEYTAYIAVMAFMPAVLWRLDTALLSGRWFPAVQAGALWGLAALCGYPSLIIIGYCYFTAWAMGRALFGPLDCGGSPPLFKKVSHSQDVPRRNIVKFIMAIKRGIGIERFSTCYEKRRQAFALQSASLIIWVLFTLVSLIVLAPAYDGFLRELAGYSDRQQALPRSEATAADALDPAALSTFASPYLAVVGAYRPHRLWSTDVANSSVYLSPLFAVLGLAAVMLRPADRFRWWLAAMGLFCLAAAMGDTLPVRGWLYDLLPPMRYFRHAAVFRCHYLFSLLLLAVMASRDFCVNEESTAALRSKCLAACGVFLACAAAVTMAAVFVAAPWDGKELGMTIVAMVHALVTWGGAAALLIGMRQRIGCYAVALCAADAVLTVVLSRPVMYTDRDHVWSAVEKQQQSSIDLTEQPLERERIYRPSPASPVNACLVAKIPVLRAFNVLHNKFYDSPEADALLAQQALGNDRVWFAAAAEPAPYSPASLDRLVQDWRKRGQLPLLITDPEALDATSATVPSSPAATLQPLKVHMQRYTSRQMEFEAVCPSRGWLLVTDRWAKSWRVTVNGQPAKLWIGNLLFRAVQVERGENRVSFDYCPRALAAWLASSWSLLAVVAIASVCPMRRR